MTLGEHIQALRKSAALSQEALGERLGVTRQSISKWESDLAMPEIDKLVAMSRLFSVTVGSLLQVEESAEGPGGLPSRELTDRELLAVEAIAARYAGDRSASRRGEVSAWRLTALAAAILTVALLAAVAVLGAQVTQLRAAFEQEEYSVAYKFSALQGQLDTLRAQPETETLLLDPYECWTITQIDPLAGEAVFSFRATLRTSTADTEVRFVAHLGSGEDLTSGPARAQAGGVYVLDSFRVPLDDTIDFYALVEDQGERSMEVLSPGVSGLATLTSLRPSADGPFPTSWSGVWRLKGRFSLDVEGGGSTYEWASGVWPVSGGIQVYLDGELQADFPAEIDGDIREYADTLSFGVDCDISLDLSDHQAERGPFSDYLKVVAYVVDNYGRRTETKRA